MVLMFEFPMCDWRPSREQRSYWTSTTRASIVALNGDRLWDLFSRHYFIIISRF